MIRILIADDHRVFREGIKLILENLQDIEVVGEASDGMEVLQQIETSNPDVILLDISMGELGGIETALILKEKYPGTKILVLSMHHESSYIVHMLEAGAAGFLLKDSGSRELINAIRTVAEGGVYYSKQVSAAIVAHLTKQSASKEKKTNIPLTKREQEVLRLIAEENSNAEIADRLFISIRTVDTHRRNLLEKLGAKNTAGLVKAAIKLGLIHPE